MVLFLRRAKKANVPTLGTRFLVKFPRMWKAIRGQMPHICPGFPPPPLELNIREVKHDVYSKRQTAKMKLLPSVFSSLYSRIKIFVFAVNSMTLFYFCVIYLRITRKE